jgi:5-methyltetrahydrofolate--homocysteine methyltransferase
MLPPPFRQPGEPALGGCQSGRPRRGEIPLSPERRGATDQGNLVGLQCAAGLRGQLQEDQAKDLAPLRRPLLPLGLFVGYFAREGAPGEQESARPAELFAAWREAAGDAVSHTRQRPEVDGERVALVGFSLGGSLALAAAQDDARLAGVVEFVGALPRELRPRLKRVRDAPDSAALPSGRSGRTTIRETGPRPIFRGCRVSRLLDVLKSGRVLLMDGALGTELQKAGLRDDENSAAWTLLHPERVRAVHAAYRAAGAEVFLTNTFMAHAASLADTMRAAGRVPFSAHELWTKGYELIAPPEAPVFRLADHGPVAGPLGPREFEQWGWFYTSHTIYEGADGAVLETCSSPRARYALRRIRESCDKPVLLSLCFLRDDAGRLVSRSGHPPEWFADRAARWGADALGVNCGRDLGMAEVTEIVRRYRRATDLPLFARPNAGTPVRAGAGWAYPHTPAKMAARLPELLEAGVSMVGGCCGTTPAHVAAFRPVLDAWNARRA